MAQRHFAIPSSKSMTQRALIIGALSARPSRIIRALWCDDSKHLTTLLRSLGCEVTWSTHQTDGQQSHVATVFPTTTLKAPATPIFCGNAGTTLRFGACLSLLCDGRLHLDGDAHMRKRPVKHLVESLESMGVKTQYLQHPGCPPLILDRDGPPAERIEVNATASSQYASGLLMVAPRLAAPLRVNLKNPAERVVSRPYITMTIEMMKRAGATLQEHEQEAVSVSPTGYAQEPASHRDIAIETDWSAGAFLLTAAELVGAPKPNLGLTPASQSLQGDAAFAAMLESIDTAEVNRFDLTETPDLIAPLVARCLFANKPTEIRGAEHTRIKECDRVAVLCRELSKLGASLHPREDGLDMMPLSAGSTKSSPAALDPESDHRMAMAFGVISLRLAGIRILTPNCVTKSFPDFWSVIEPLRATDTPAPP